MTRYWAVVRLALWEDTRVTCGPLPMPGRLRGLGTSVGFLLVYATEAEAQVAAGGSVVMAFDVAEPEGSLAHTAEAGAPCAALDGPGAGR